MQYGFMDTGSQFLISERIKENDLIEKFIGYVDCPNRAWGKEKIIKRISVSESKFIISKNERSKDFTYRINQ